MINSTIYKDIDYHFTFNYTPTFEKVYSQNIRTDFLHGKIDSKNNFIVLGINEVPENINENHENFLYLLQNTIKNLIITLIITFLMNYLEKIHSKIIFFIL